VTPHWYDAENWLDILDHAWYGLVLLGMAAIPSWISLRNHRSITDIKDQVVNGHKEPLRADLDKALAAIESLARDVRGIRTDLATEEDRRRKQINELREDVERLGPHPD
jgi:hypothetical protein